MYQPREFAGDDDATAYAHIAGHPFGILVSADGGGPAATHLPFLLDDEERPAGLVGHMARRNPQWERIADGAPVLCVFPGPDAYISPNAYTAEPDVPTWNYTAVHVHGRFRRIADPAELRALLERTVRVFERGSPRPWPLASMDPADLAGLARGVVGFAVTATRVSGGYKLSQDKLAEDVGRVREHLAASERAGDRAVAAAMREHRIAGRTGPPSTDPASWPPGG